MEKKEILDFEVKGNEFFKKYIAESVNKIGFFRKLFLSIFGKQIISWDSTDKGIEFLYCREWRGKLYIMKEELVSKLKDNK